MNDGNKTLKIQKNLNRDNKLIKKYQDPKIKRQQYIFQFYEKSPVVKISNTRKIEEETQPTLDHDTIKSSAPDAVKTRGEAVEVLGLPEFWCMEQFENFKEKYNGLIIHSKKLGMIDVPDFILNP